ncbi:MAG: trypsin-like peptidase domain-containing protein [Candidatus Promineifilaceae bacterium]|nr:trypsin-like peptidase domain-containing protein [Candidatus Promineifilaceae bacterium]
MKHDGSREVTAEEREKRPQWWRRLGAALRRVWPFALGIAAALLAVLLYTFLFPAPTPLTENEIKIDIAEAMASATPEAAYSAQVYERILPSLVLVKANFGPAEEGDEDDQGLGSGTVINENGDILTALHVVAGAQEIVVVYADGTEAAAEIGGAEPENDIAVLQPTQPPGLIVPAVLGNPYAMAVGDEAFAVGNPMGLTASMSAGVISGFNRSIPVGEGQRLERLIQFDTAVNPGNSGGPLLNREGQVVGIVTALANPSEQNFFVGIGFAVPIGTAVAAAGAPGY